MELDLYKQIRNDATPITVEVDGKTYATQSLRLVEETEKLRSIPRCKTITSLDALCALITKEASVIYPESNLFVSVSGYDHVSVFTDIFQDRWERQELYYAELKDAPGWKDEWFDYESAVIALRSRFVPNDGTAYLLDILSRMSNQAEVRTNDNGMTQQTVVKKGITLVGAETITPILPLRPYRTFQEIDQPESEFLVRIREMRGENMIGLLESDGGMWKMEARRAIYTYLEARLSNLGEKIVLTL
jgi:hypothetical protein